MRMQFSVYSALNHSVSLLTLFVLLLSGCATTVSRSPTLLENGQIAAGVSYGTSHDLLGPESLDSPTGTPKAENKRTLLPFASLGLSEKNEISASGFFAMTSGGLYGQWKRQILNKKTFEATLIADAFAYFSNSTRPDQGAIRSHYERDSELAYGLTVAPSFGVTIPRIHKQALAFGGPELTWLSLSAKHAKSRSDIMSHNSSGLLYGAFVGYSMPITKIGDDELLGEVTLRAQSGPKNVVESSRQLYYDAFLSIRYAFETEMELE